MATAPETTTRHDPRERFERFAAQWRTESRSMSNVMQMAMLQSYQNIIGMGESALPHILEDLRRRPAQWFWALEAITLEDPVPDEAYGDMDRAAAAWVQWGIENGYLSR